MSSKLFEAAGREQYTCSVLALGPHTPRPDTCSVASRHATPPSLQVWDFRTGVTVTVVTVPGEEDLGQPRYQVLVCSSLDRRLKSINLEALNCPLSTMYNLFRDSNS